MTLVLDERVDLSSARSIRLGGQELKVASLVLRQTSVISPQISTVLRILSKRTVAADAFKASRVGVDPEIPLTMEELAKIGELMTLTEDETSIAMNVIRVGLSRAYPKVTDDDLYDLPVTMEETIGALAVVMSQTRLVEKTKAPPSGEAKAAT